MENNEQSSNETGRKTLKKALVAKMTTEISTFNVETAKELWYESRKMNAELKTLKTQSDERILKYSLKLQFLKETLEKTFDERDAGLTALYRNLEKAEHENDKELLVACLMQISGIIIKNPLADFTKISQALEFGNDDVLELDF